MGQPVTFTTIVAPTTGTARLTGTVAVDSAVDNPGSTSVTLHPTQRLNLHWTYTLTIQGSSADGVTNTQGVLIDGDNDGHPGGNYSTTITRRNFVCARSPVL